MEENNNKSRLAAGLLGMFLGSFGAHNFYLNKKKRAFTQLGLMIGGIALMILSYVIYFIAIFSMMFSTITMEMNSNMESAPFFGFFMYFIIFYIMLLVGILLISAAQLWGFIEGILILIGTIKKDGAGNDLDKPIPEGQKSKVAAGVLGIVLGTLGIHNFYLGYTGKGIAQLLLTLLGGCIILGPIAAFIWSLIEGIQILTGNIDKDAKDIPLFQD